MSSLLLQLAGRRLGPWLRGALDYYRKPQLRQAWGGPFNGQTFRRRLFDRLVSSMNFEYIVETGTHRGTTTEYMARSTQVPVYTIEADPKLAGFAWVRLRRLRNVHIQLGDSVESLKLILGSPRMRSGLGFFYLDAHWGADLPLAREVSMIVNSCQRAVVMIDDFRVPGDEGYGFDDYGPGRALEIQYLKPTIAQFNLRLFFPACPSKEETGSRRGSVVITWDNACSARLSEIDLLREWQTIGT